MKPQIGINPKNLDEVAKLLHQVLADEFVLYVKTLNAHWNVEGIDFYNKHLFFGAQYMELATIIDRVAERIRALGHYAPATLTDFLRLTHLTEQSREANTGTGFIKILAEDHNAIIMTLRAYVKLINAEDLGTGDFATALIEKHEKMCWKLRSHLA